MARPSDSAPDYPKETSSWPLTKLLFAGLLFVPLLLFLGYITVWAIGWWALLSLVGLVGASLAVYFLANGALRHEQGNDPVGDAKREGGVTDGSRLKRLLLPRRSLAYYVRVRAVVVLILAICIILLHGVLNVRIHRFMLILLAAYIGYVILQIITRRARSRRDHGRPDHRPGDQFNSSADDNHRQGR